MVDSDAGQEGESRPPTLEDLLHLCSELNRLGAKYIVVGGMAIIRLGFARATEDIDLLVDSSPENQELVRQALMTLPDRAVREMTMTDLDEYQVIRIADEIVVDLMKSACGIAYPEASQSIEWEKIEGVSIPSQPWAATEVLLVFLRVFVSLWLELSNKYHEDSKTRRNTKNLAKKAQRFQTRHTWDS